LTLILFAHNFKLETNIIENVHQIQITVPWAVRYVCVYIFKIDDSYIMFDAGLDMGNWPKLFFSALDKIGISMKEIDYCFISHEHTDHTGLMRRFKRLNPNIQIMMSEAAHETLKWETNPDNYKELLEGAKEMGLQVPGDLSIVGFDDMEIASFITPGLSTIRQPAYTMGKLGVEILLDHIKDRSSSAVHKILETSLVIRDSTSTAPLR